MERPRPGAPHTLPGPQSAIRELTVSNGTHADIFRALARELSGIPDLYTQLLKEHLPAAAGHCIKCTMRGSQKQTPWPCSIYALAVMAQGIEVGRPAH